MLPLSKRVPWADRAHRHAGTMQLLEIVHVCGLGVEGEVRFICQGWLCRVGRAVGLCGVGVVGGVEGGLSLAPLL